MALGGDLGQPSVPGGLLDVDHLSDLPGEPLKQPGEQRRLTDPAELADVALPGECGVVLEPPVTRASGARQPRPSPTQLDEQPAPNRETRLGWTAAGWMRSAARPSEVSFWSVLPANTPPTSVFAVGSVWFVVDTSRVLDRVWSRRAIPATLGSYA